MCARSHLTPSWFALKLAERYCGAMNRFGLTGYCRKIRQAVVLAALASVCGGPLAQAQTPGFSAWAAGQKSAARLVAEGIEGDAATTRAALQIRLDPKFKTYWRTPGDAGVPPAFDWSSSENVADVDVQYPAPVRFADGAGFSIGYDRGVAFPLKVTLKDPAKPARLGLKLNYAVCEKLCIPVEADVSLAIPRRRDAAARRLIEEEEARVPIITALGSAVKGLAVTDLRVETTEGRGELVAVIKAEGGARPDDVFAEAPGLWLFGRPQVEPGAGGNIVARLPIEDRPKEMPAGALPVTLTVVSGDASIEVKASLDVKALAR
jgi:DsbC/DsbD-like thiol-disulfide interchange protein